jgi:hypothetical protein
MTPAGHAAFRARVDAVYAKWLPLIDKGLAEAVSRAAQRAAANAGAAAPASGEVGKGSAPAPAGQPPT